MNMFDCEKEALVIEAVKSGNWDDELRSHAASCEVCADVFLAGHLLQELSACDKTQAVLPNGGLIWWKAQWKAKRAAAERATQPISIVEKISCVCAVLCAIGLCVWQWNPIRAWWASVSSGWHMSSNSVQQFVVSLWEKSSPAIVLCASVLVIFLIFVGYLVGTEE